MNHYVYQITNQLNGKIYVGKRANARAKLILGEELK